MDVAATLAQVKAFWIGLPPERRRLAVAGGVALAVLLVLALAVAARGPQYAPLFTRLESQDAAAIAAKLDAEKVPYRISADGSTISVPASQVYRLRLSLAAQGLPSSGVVGFEALDKLGFAATDFQRQVDYLRGLQGELTRTILQIDGVAAARVHIVLPQDQLFDKQATPATAAVFLRLKPGASLDAGQVRAIAHLVASSVRALKPDDVTIVDDHGRLLSAALGADRPAQAATAAANDLQLQQQFQQALQRGLDQMLAQVFGPGNVVTRVQAELNFDRQTVTRSLFQPVGQGQGVLKSVQELREHFQGQGAPPGGVPGASSNGVPSYPAAAAGGSSTYDKQQVTRDFNVSQVEDKTEVAPGSVKRLSVAVVVNRQLTPADQQAVLSAVTAAIGADPARRDQITVVGMPFSTSIQEQLPPAPAPRAGRTPLVYAAAAGVLAVLLVAAWSLFGGRRRAAPSEAELAAELLAKARGENGQAAVAPRSALSDELGERVRRRPEHVAAILRLWMSED